MSRGTENERPIACVLVGYGSWPRITARTDAKGVARRAAKTRPPSGSTVPMSRSCATKSAIGATRSADAAGPIASAQPSGIVPMASSRRASRSPVMSPPLRRLPRRGYRRSRAAAAATRASRYGTSCRVPWADPRGSWCRLAWCAGDLLLVVASGRVAVGPHGDVGRLDTEQRQGRAHLAPVVRAVLHDLSQPHSDRSEIACVAVEVLDLAVRVGRIGEDLEPEHAVRFYPGAEFRQLRQFVVHLNDDPVTEEREVPGVGVDKVVKRSVNRSVRPGNVGRELLGRERGARVDEPDGRPGVVTKSVLERMAGHLSTSR